ncbi:xanthine dehydrogenase family protein molybdopterin-binding subunit [Usitatibacter palustris]|uniref:Isoquinoline 1-oxidoreductase subunit beta n=1 Tax=Usitatibacter palustris TaxID=2732487 RepID=A0A6M4H6W3_9PROT|nr:xanthine dehydrogenase family protein molybdopterin-binding subunit [Usitatibacter palustris]QJR15361.1 Isoquinoline 1-oxidoreductase subunit beta [Usitatibacter palustris]
MDTFVTRRDFLQAIAATGGFALAGGINEVFAADPPKYGADGMPNGWIDNPLVFVAIAPDGIVSVTCHRAEMGQGVRTGVTMIIADELEADWSKIRVVQAPGDEKKYGNQDTDGSRTTRHFFTPMRRCGAAARQMLEGAAAAKWGVPVSEVKAANHVVTHAKSGKTAGYGELAADAAKQPVPTGAAIKLKDPKDFRYIGKGKTPIVDGFDMTTGKGMYAQDVVMPGMLFAVIARSPVYGGKVKSFDATAARQVKGVVNVVEIKGTDIPAAFAPLAGVAVIAENTWAAIQGRKALKIEWDGGANASYDSDKYRAGMEAAAVKPGKVIRTHGDVDKAMAGAAKTLKADYYIPHLAQAPMEPPAATAVVKDGKCEVWTCAQSPQAARNDVAKRLGMKPEDVTINVTLLGGGFGRKSKADFAVEAALLANEMPGKPVKVVWTREDDLHHSFYHTVSVEHLEAGLDKSGKPVAWLHRSVGPTLMALFMPDPKVESAIEIGMGLANVPFEVPNVRIENPEAAAHTRVGWYRAVSNIPHAFAVQSMVCEMANAAGRDPKDFLLELMGPARKIDPRTLNDTWNHGEDPSLYVYDVGRLRNVTEIAAKASGWGGKLPKGQGRGIAAHYSFTTYVASVIQVAVDAKGALTIPRVDIVIDCGAQVNPERIRSQMEGAVIMGLSNAMLSEITYKNGAVVQDNFHQYEILRMNMAPRAIHVHLVPGDYSKHMGGVGEPGVPPIAPALCNAIFAATGKRIRALPIKDQLKA